jgi:cytochrome c biogenesis protein CcdA
MLMLSVPVVPVLLSVLVGLLLGLVAWGALGSRHQDVDNLMGMRDDVLLGLLVLAAFALGVFLAYVMFR